MWLVKVKRADGLAVQIAVETLDELLRVVAALTLEEVASADLTRLDASRLD